ncbi:hypothetical protein SLE2022_268820 [Rubroshorea leprosula]
MGSFLQQLLFMLLSKFVCQNHRSEALMAEKSQSVRVQFTGGVLRIRCRFWKMQAPVDPERMQRLPESRQRVKCLSS